MRGKTIIATIAVCVLAATARAERVVVSEKPGHTSQATVTVDVAPEEAYRIATEYAEWPKMLTDVTSLKVERGGRRDARLRFRSRALGSVVKIQLDNNDPDRAIRFRAVDGPPGSRAYGEYRFEPIAGGRTRITATFMLHAGGISGWFVHGAVVDHMRRTKIESDLADLARWFAKP